MAQAGLDFSDFTADRTRDFAGREWVFAEIDEWLADAHGCATPSTPAGRTSEHRQG
jgi:hypothetical protein